MARELTVRHYRQIVLWPLQLMPLRPGEQVQRHWEALREQRVGNPWREVDDAFGGDPAQFQERHYKEFVTFLPYVQRFLYGSAAGQESTLGADQASMRVFRRDDVAQGARHLRPGPGADRIQGRAGRPVLLHGCGHRHPGGRNACRRYLARLRAGHHVPLRPRLSRVLGSRRRRRQLPACGRMAGCGRATSSPHRISPRAPNTFRSSPATARPASPTTGSICCCRSRSNFRGRARSCAIASSSITACRS